MRERTVVRTSFTSATMPRSACTFLLMDAGSQSTWTSFAFFAYSESFAVTRSEKRTPSATMRSASWMDQFAAALPCMPLKPRASASRSSKDPRPMSVVVTGICARCASAARSFAAPDAITPPPA